MKIRILKRLVNGTFNICIQTEDWSEQDRTLMVKYGEPEIDLGGEFTYTDEDDEKIVTLDSNYVRIFSESPFTRKFDSRDYGSTDSAKQISTAWSTAIEERIATAVMNLRAQDEFMTTEEISEY